MKYMRGAALAAAVVCMLLAPSIPLAADPGGRDAPAPAISLPGPPMLRLKCGEFDPLAAQAPIPDQMRIPFSQGVYIVQFEGPIYPGQTAAVLQQAEILAYIPDYAYAILTDDAGAAAIRSQDLVRYVGLFEPGYKVDPALRLGDTPRQLTVLCFRGQDIPLAAARIAAIGAVIQSQDPLAIRVLATGSMALGMAFIPEVQWIEEYNPPQFDNGNAARITKIRSNADGAYNWGTTALWSYNPVTKKYEGYAGANFTAAVADTGIDGTHPAFTGKKVAYYAYGGTDWYDYYGSTAHGTHTAGTVLGNGGWRNETNPGPSYGRYAGMAPLAGLVGQMMAGYCTYYDLCHDAVASGAVVSSNSWGGGAGGSYDASASEYDYMVRDARNDRSGNQSLTVTFSAGNSGPGIGTIDPPSTAKNVISVGATDDSSGNNIADFSSRGPCSDGRIKPDIVAPGVNVNSAWGNSGQSYHTMSGTSMSCPVVAGATLVVNEYYCITRGSVPSPAMVKNILINGADAMSGYPYPGGAQGWGRLNLAKSLLNTTNRKIWTQDQGAGLLTGVAENLVFNITTAGELKISLVWTDVNGTPGASQALVNDLDLRVTAPNGTVYFGNFFNNSYSAVNGSSDLRNNVEVVRLAGPPSGQWRVSVKGRNVPLGPQDYTLVIGGPVANITRVRVNIAAGDISVAPADPAEGDMVTLSASIVNLGELAEKNVYYRFTLTDGKGLVRNLGVEQLPVIPVGGSMPVMANWTAMRGCYTVALEVDPFSVVSEERVDDNVASIGLKVRGYGLELNAPSTEILVDPGRSNDFPLIVSNRANTVDNFTLAVDSPIPSGDWTAGIQDPVLQVPEGANSTFTCFIAPPAKAWAGYTFPLRIRATSQGNGSYTATVDLTVTVNKLFAVNISVGGAEVWVNPGVLATIPLKVDNSGNSNDTITLSLWGVPLGWQASLSYDYLIVERFSSMNLSILVLSPSNAPGLSVASFDVRAGYGNGRTATATVTMHVRHVPDIVLELADGPDTEDPGGNASYVLRLKNRGNGADPFRMAAELPQGWTGEFTGVTPVVAGDFVLVDFLLSVPADAAAGEREFSLTAISGINGSVTSTVQLLIEVNQLFGVELSSDQARVGLETGNSTRIEALVNNSGNGDDVIFFEAEDSLPPGWRISFMPSLVKLPAGGTTTIVIKVRSPENSTEGGYFFSLRAISSGDSLKVSSVRFRIDLTNPPVEPVIPAVNNTRPPQYTGLPPPPPPDRLTRLLSSGWFFPMVLMALVAVSVAAFGASRVRRKKNLALEGSAVEPYGPMHETEEPLETVDMMEGHSGSPPGEAPKKSLSPPVEPPVVAPPERAGPAAVPILKSEAYESEMDTVDMGPAVDIGTRKTGGPISPTGKAAKKAPQKTSDQASAPQPAAKKLVAKNVDSEIEDILSRIDGISKK